MRVFETLRLNVSAYKTPIFAVKVGTAGEQCSVCKMHQYHRVKYYIYTIAIYKLGTLRFCISTGETEVTREAPGAILKAYFAVLYEGLHFACKDL